MNKTRRTLPITSLILTIIFLALAVVTLLVGSNKSKVYNQMKQAVIVDNFTDLIDSNSKPFLLLGYIGLEHKSTDGMVATLDSSPELSILLGSQSTRLFKDYKLADTNMSIEKDGQIIEGIKPGGDVTIYAVNYKDDNFIGIKGYELYPGNPKQYIEFLKSPYNAYMLYVRLFIGLSLLFFLISIVLNIKK